MQDFLLIDEKTVKMPSAHVQILVDMKVVNRIWKYETAHVKEQIPCDFICHVLFVPCGKKPIA